LAGIGVSGVVAARLTTLSALTATSAARTACASTTPTWTTAARSTTTGSAGATHEDSHPIAAGPTRTACPSLSTAKRIRSACATFHAAGSKTAGHSFPTAEHHSGRTEIRKVLTGRGASTHAAAHQKRIRGCRFAQRTGIDLRHRFLALSLECSLQLRVNLLESALTARSAWTTLLSRTHSGESGTRSAWAWGWTTGCRRLARTGS
jgi:hypothetical protein